MGDTVLLDDRFEGSTLDETKWFPHYLPAWSSRAATRPSYRCGPRGFTLDVPVDHPVWCPEDHDPPLRVSGIQSGSWSGPVGSPRGQQRFREGQVVREEQPWFDGCLVAAGAVAIEASMSISARSMAALWLSGFEDDPDQLQCGEICVFEVFGDAPDAVGMGIKPFRDPALTWDFDAPRLPIDVREHHAYAADWRPGRVDFSVDGQVVRSVAQAPDYPVQFMVAVFDFPERAGPPDHVPLLAVDRVSVR
jgi:hypothetical protein